MRRKIPACIAVLLVLAGVSYGSIIDIGATGNGAFNMNVTSAQGIWTGYIAGGGINAELLFADGVMGEKTKMGVAIFGTLTYDRLYLPADKFDAGTYYLFYNMPYGAILKLHLDNLYFGAGVTAVYSYAGQYGNDSLPLPKDMTNASSLGHTVYASALAGYMIPLIENFLYIPVEIKADFGVSIPDACPMHLGGSVGVTIRL